MAFSLKSLFRREQAEARSDDSANSLDYVAVRQSSQSNHPRVHNPSTVADAPHPAMPMNIASPFQPVAEEGFTIRELSMLLPPQLLQTENLPPDYLVPLPLEALRGSFQAGRPCLRLSQIYQTCPYLFQRPVHPNEDQEVALPYQKVRRILEGGSAGVNLARAAGAPFAVAEPEDPPFANREAVPSSSPFSLAKGAVLSPEDQPFLAPALPVAPASPFQIVASSLAPPAPPAPVVESPFSLAEKLPVVNPFSETPPAFPAPHSSSPFQLAHPVSAPPSAPPVGALPMRVLPTRQELPPPALPPARMALPPLPTAESRSPVPVVGAASPEAEDHVRLSLASVLRSVSMAELGFDPSNVPEVVSVSFPLSLIRPQLASGKVEVTLPEILAGVAEKFQPAFARARPSLIAVLPLSDLFHAMPSAIPVAAPEPPPAAPPASFQTPFQSHATVDAVRIPQPPPTPVPVLPEPQQEPAIALETFYPQPPAAVVAPVILPSFITPHADLGEPHPASTLNDPPPQHLPLRGAAPQLAPAMQMPAPLPPLLQPPPAATLPPIISDARPRWEPSLAAPPVLKAVEETLVPLPPLPAAPAPAPASQDFQFGYKEHPAQMALHHWLQATGEMTPQHTVNHVGKLPGVRAAVLISAATMASTGESSCPHALFFDKAKLRYQSLKLMLENMDQPTEGSFTMRFDQLVTTFFLAGDICLAVLQDAANLEETLRDKLSLVTREIAALP